MHKIKIQKDENGFKDGNPIKFYTKHDPEMESDSAPRIRELQVNEADLVSEVICLQRLEGVPAISTTILSEKLEYSMPKTKVEAIEQYCCGTKSLQMNQAKLPLQLCTHVACKQQQYLHSPDILSSQVCSDFDLVKNAPSTCSSSKENSSSSSTKSSTVFQTFYTAPKITVTKEEGSDKIKVERQQPDGVEEKKIIADAPLQINIQDGTSGVLKQEKSTETTPPGVSEDNLDAVIESISHDLDYLLNHDSELDLEPAAPVNYGSLRRMSKHPPIIEQVEEEEEEEKKDSEIVTSILRTKCWRLIFYFQGHLCFTSCGF